MSGLSPRASVRAWPALTSAIALITASLALPAPAWASELSATPSTFAGVFAQAQGGDTILLASGDYGTWSGGSKPSTVTLQPAAGATPTMRLAFTSAANLRLQGLTIPEAEIAGTTRNVTIAGSDVTGDVTIRTQQFNNNNIVLDGNRHIGISPSGGYEGRITLPSAGPNPSGVIIENSLFAGGYSDGIQNGSNGTQILGNEFKDLLQGDPNVAHTDAIQLYGSSNTVIRGNYFHHVEDGIMAPDGADHEDIENNVFVTTGDQYAVTLGSDDHSIVRHNTMVATGLRMQQKSGMPAPVGTVIKDNVMADLAREAGTADQGYNLIAGSGPRTASDLKGSARFVGGASPTSFAGFALAADSPGKANASDGLDRGIVPGPPPPAGGPGTTPVPGSPGAPGTPGAPGGGPTPPSTVPPSSPTTPAQTVGTLRASWRVSPARPTVGRRVVLTVPAGRRLGWHCRWRYGGHVRTGCRVAYRFRTAGIKVITLVVRDRAGRQGRATTRIRIRSARAHRR